ncbi:hypothetical protein CHOED_051 [Vibrio phage CHOED]|uniref:hypothetical protein n=1 Tax=Vibrio phage CHOED TaxID=1458716 RepID=UPI00042F20FC|nr:hypothetical protein CHOED_051 [Vibrio phage CHOED]AHK11911.1 hypothetical protein CHOED_051 [Vibrio phage CHOED]
MQYFRQGDTMRVCGGSKEIHGFEPDELVKVIQARPEHDLSYVALCRSVTTGHTSILMIEEVEDL